MNPRATRVRTFAAWLLSVSCLLATSCADSPRAEADWNKLHIWHRVADIPPTYVPAGYGSNQPRNERDGTWFTDERDGKRLFVPSQPVGEWKPGALIGEAKKATGYVYRSGKTPGEKAFALPVWMILRTAAPVPLPD